MFLDDLQWADVATLELLERWALTLTDEPVLLIGAYRSDGLARRHPLRRLRAQPRRGRGVLELSVGPLDQVGTALLVGERPDQARSVPTVTVHSDGAQALIVFVRDTLGPQLGVPVDHVAATVRCEADARGLLGMNGATPNLRACSVDVTVTSPAGADGVAELARVWRQRCPIYLALVNPTQVAVRFQAAT